MNDATAGVVEVTPETAYAALRADPRAVLVDVRTDNERLLTGSPDLAATGGRVVYIPWPGQPTMRHGTGFAEALARAGLGPDQPLYFLCAIGARSRAAAAEALAAGFVRAFNIAGGFVGTADRHPGAVAGWKAAGLPWRR